MADETHRLVLEASVQDEITAPLQAPTHAVQQLGEAAAQAGRKAGNEGAAGMSRLERTVNQLRTSLSGLDDRLRTISRRLDTAFVTAARRTVFALGGIATAAAYMGAKASSSFQQSQIAFETLLGSAEKGRALFKELQTINLTTPFQLADLTQATQVLLRYNVAGDQVLGIVKSLSDAAALTTNPGENLQRLALATGQVATRGSLQGQDARQLIEAGIDAYGLYANKLGITRKEAQKLGEQGKLTADILLTGITNLEGPLEKVRGGAEKMSKTLLGQLSNLKDAVNVQLATAATPLVDELGNLIGTGEKPGILVTGITSLIATVGPPFFHLLGSLAGLLSKALPAVQPILSAITGGLDQLIKAAGPALHSLEPLGGQIGHSLTELFDALAPEMPQLVRLLGDFIQLLPDMIRLLTALVPLIDPIARLTSTLLEFGPVRGVMAGLLVTLLGYRALSGVASTLFAIARGIRAIAAADEIAAAAKYASGTAGAAGAAGGSMPVWVKAARWLAKGPGPAAAGAETAAEVGAGAAGGTTALAVGGGLVLGAAALFGLYKLMEHYDNKSQKGYPIDPRTNLPFNLADSPQATLPYGDAIAPRLARSLRADAGAEAATPGSRALTSSLRTFGVGAGSGHLRGTATDRAGSWMGRYRENVIKAGGWAVQHDNHVHADWGDAAAPPRGGGGGGRYADGMGGDTFVIQGDVYGVPDLEARFESFSRQLKRRDTARARSPQGAND